MANFSSTEQLEEELIRANRDIAKSRDQARKVEAKLAAADVRNDELLTKVAELDKEITHKKHTILVLEKKIAEVAAEATARVADESAWDQEKEALHDEVVQLQQERERVAEQLEEERKQHGATRVRLTQTETASRENANRASDHGKQLKELQEVLHGKDQEKEAIREEMMRLQHERERFADQLEEERKQHGAARVRLTQLETLSRESSSKATDQGKQLQELQEALHRKDLQLEQQEAAIRHLQQELHEARRNLDEKGAGAQLMEEELDQARRMSKEKSDLLDQRGAAVETLEQRLEQASRKEMELEELVTTAKREAEAEVHVASLRHAQLEGELRSRIEQLTEAEGRLDSQRQLLQQLRDALAEATAERDELRAAVAEAEAERDRLRDALSLASSERDGLAQARDSLSRDLQQKESLSRDAQVAQEEFEHREQQKLHRVQAQLKSAHEEALSERESAKHMKEFLGKELQLAREDAEQREREARAARLQLQQAREDFEEQLRRQRDAALSERSAAEREAAEAARRAADREFQEREADQRDREAAMRDAVEQARRAADSEEMLVAQRRCEQLMRNKGDLQQEVANVREQHTALEIELQKQRAAKEKLAFELEQLRLDRSASDAADSWRESEAQLKKQAAAALERLHHVEADLHRAKLQRDTAEAKLRQQAAELIARQDAEQALLSSLGGLRSLEEVRRWALEQAVATRRSELRLYAAEAEVHERDVQAATEQAATRRQGREEAAALRGALDELRYMVKVQEVHTAGVGSLNYGPIFGQRRTPQTPIQ